MYKKGIFKDAMYLTYGIPAFGEQCYEILNPLIHNFAEYLDVSMINPDLNIKLVNVTKLVDALDYDRLQFERLASGDPPILLDLKWHATEKEDV